MKSSTKELIVVLAAFIVAIPMSPATQATPAQQTKGPGERDMTTKSTPALTLTLPSDREVLITRDFEAPPTLVWNAITQPELLKRWMQAPGRSFDTCEIDLKPGGAYRFVWRGPGRRDVGMHGVYQEVQPSKRIVNTESWEDWDAGESLVTTVLTEKDGKTVLTITTRFPSQKVRDDVMKAGLEANAQKTYDSLDALLRSML